MTFTLTINIDNDAFAPGDAGVELSRLLRNTADRVAHDDTDHFYLRDVNGNIVGAVTVTDD